MTPNRSQNCFDLIRLALASMVILAHSPELVDGSRNREPLTWLFGTLTLGELAVNGFFILSGYLILKSWIASPRLIDFLRKRVLRIYPGFIVASLLSALVVGPLGTSAERYFASFDWRAYAKSVLLLHRPEVPATFIGQPHPSVNAAMWTIEYEFRCYIFCAALALSFTVLRSAKRWIWLATTIAFVFLSLFPSLTESLHFPWSWLIIGTPERFFRLTSLFFIGGCFHLFRIPFNRRGAIVAIAILMFGLSINVQSAQFACSTAGAYILFWIGLCPGFRRLQGMPDVSYGVYLYGWPIQKLIVWYDPAISPWLLFPFALCGAMFCGVMSWYLVEQPFLKLKPRQQSSRVRTSVSTSQIELTKPAMVSTFPPG